MVQEIRSLQKLAIFFRVSRWGRRGGGLYAVLYGTSITFLYTCTSITEDTQDRLEDLALILIEYEIAAFLGWWIGVAGVYHRQNYRKVCREVSNSCRSVSIFSMLLTTQYTGEKRVESS